MKILNSVWKWGYWDFYWDLSILLHEFKSMYMFVEPSWSLVDLGYLNLAWTPSHGLRRPVLFWDSFSFTISLAYRMGVVSESYPVIWDPTFCFLQKLLSYQVLLNSGALAKVGVNDKVERC